MEREGEKLNGLIAKERRKRFEVSRGDSERQREREDWDVDGVLVIIN